MCNEIKNFFNQVASKRDNFEKLTEEDIFNLIEQLNIKENSDCLDVACGTGIISGSIFKFSKKEVTAIDLSENMIEIAKNKYEDSEYNVNFICDDFLTHKFNKTFDYIIIFNAYPHFIDVNKLINALKINLKDKGKFIILHSMSLNELNALHKKVNHKLYREITSFKEEAKLFEKEFNILKVEEDNKILLIGEKK